MQPTMTARSQIAVEFIARIGMSPQERFGLGAALLCQCAEQANEECGPDSGNPFRDVPMIDQTRPFETAILVLQAFIDWCAKKEAEAAVTPDPELQDAGRAEKVDSILAEGRAAVRAEAEGLEQDKVEQVKVQVEP
jgi:hypothetical protein